MHKLAGLLVIKGCSYGDLQHNRLAVEPCAIRSHAVLAALCLVLRVVAEVNEGVMTLRRLHNYVAATAAVAARRSAAGHKLFPAKRHAAIAAVASFYPDFRFIDKHK